MENNLQDLLKKTYAAFHQKNLEEILSCLQKLVVVNSAKSLPLITQALFWKEPKQDIVRVYTRYALSKMSCFSNSYQDFLLQIPDSSLNQLTQKDNENLRQIINRIQSIFNEIVKDFNIALNNSANEENHEDELDTRVQFLLELLFRLSIWVGERDQENVYVHPMVAVLGTTENKQNKNLLSQLFEVVIPILERVTLKKYRNLGEKRFSPVKIYSFQRALQLLGYWGFFNNEHRSQIEEEYHLVKLNWPNFSYLSITQNIDSNHQCLKNYQGSLPLRDRIRVYLEVINATVVDKKRFSDYGKAAILSRSLSDLSRLC